jgi:hypothetical protein
VSVQPWEPSPGIVERALDTAVAWTYSAISYTRDVLPILAKYQIKQWTRDAVRNMPFLLPYEKAVVLTWLSSRGW